MAFVYPVLRAVRDGMSGRGDVFTQKSLEPVVQPPNNLILCTKTAVSVLSHFFSSVINLDVFCANIIGIFVHT